MNTFLARARYGLRFMMDPRERLVRRWFRVKGDSSLRLDYQLNADSVVFDVGGYEGNWAAAIYERYQPTIHIFEPVLAYHELIAERFAAHSRIHAWPFGLAASAGEIPISVAGDASSVFRAGTRNVEMATMQGLATFMKQQSIAKIDLLKVNIEGGEYDLLDHLLDRGLASCVTDLQVQFHDFVPDAAARSHAIQQRLRSTHRLTYQYEFVWENWHRTSANS